MSEHEKPRKGETDTERALREAREQQARQDEELAEMKEEQKRLQEQLAQIKTSAPDTRTAKERKIDFIDRNYNPENPDFVTPKTEEVKTESSEIQAKEQITAELTKKGFRIDNLSEQNFDQLGKLSRGIIDLAAELKKDPNTTYEIKDFLQNLAHQVEELIEITGIKENQRLPKADYETLQREFAEGGFFLDFTNTFTLEQLYKARKI